VSAREEVAEDDDVFEFEFELPIQTQIQHVESNVVIFLGEF
jgi:hypothetical protein